MRIDATAVYALAATAGVIGGVLAFDGSRDPISKLNKSHSGLVAIGAGVPGAIGFYALATNVMGPSSYGGKTAVSLIVAAVGVGLLLGPTVAAADRYDDLS